MFADCTDWPDVERYNDLLPPSLSARFVLQMPVVRRRNEQLIRRPEDLYDACIGRGEIPTRARSWHDYLNALVWATFPRAKSALHARQHTVIERWLRDEGAVREDGTITTLPNARTREHDALALVDEGGIVVLDTGDRQEPIVFGHALFEGLVMGTPSMISRGVEVRRTSELTPDRETWVAIADAELAERLSAPLLPEQLPRYSLHCVSQQP